MTREEIESRFSRIISHGVAITNRDIVDANIICGVFSSGIDLSLKRDIATVVISSVMGNPWSAFLIQKFDRLKLLNIFMPCISCLKKVPQDKKDQDALQHTITVLNYIDILFPHKSVIFMKYAALFHDSGKIDTMRVDGKKTTFYGHENSSVEHCTQVCKAFNLLSDDDLVRTNIVIANHMFPLAYQRNPDWGVEAIQNFVARCGGLHDYVIDLAIADKRANSARKEYVESLIELKKKCKEI